MAFGNLQESCAQILRSVRSSSLNYASQETPFSIYLTIRKSWNKHHPGHVPVALGSESLLDTGKLASENLSLKTEVTDVKAQLKAAKDIISVIETKVEVAEAEAYQLHKSIKKWKEALERNDDEIKILKSTIKSNNSEKVKNSTELISLKKVLKLRDKEIYDLENCNIDQQGTIKSLKLNESESKKEKVKLEKQAKNLEKKILNLKKKNCSPEFINNNTTVTSLAHTTCSAPTSQESSSGTSLVSSSVPLTCPPTPSSSRPEKFTTAPYSSTSLPATTSTKFTSCPLSSPTLQTTTSEVSNTCKHRPQCVQRQPKPPPPDKCSILVHNGSKYHELKTSGAHGLPACYGPHEDCMKVENRNFGCSEYIWFKKWGELHGLPDLYPWKYTQSGIYSDQEPDDN